MYISNYLFNISNVKLSMYVLPNLLHGNKHHFDIQAINVAVKPMLLILTKEVKRKKLNATYISLYILLRYKEIKQINKG